MEKKPALENLLIKETALSTHIEFNNKTNVLEMKGFAIPPNAHTFFIPIVEWAENYLKTNPVKTTVNISFKYLHTSAGKNLFELIKLLKQSEQSGHLLTINWYYEEEDEDMKQTGMDFSSILKMQFNFATFDN
jgi:hypothetical protein